MTQNRRTQELLRKLKAEGNFSNSAKIYKAPLPPKGMWGAISRGVERNPRDSFWEVHKEMLKAEKTESTAEWQWPPVGFLETSDALPQISRDEALVILDRYLKLEYGELREEARIFLFHWEVLAGIYVPLQKWHQALRMLIKEDMLFEDPDNKVSSREGIDWPLAIKKAAIKEMRKLRIDAWVPWLRRIEDSFSAFRSSYPNTMAAIFFLFTGGLLLKLGEWILGFFSRK